MKNTKYVFFFTKRKKKQDISVVLLIKMYKKFVNFFFFLCLWSSVYTVGIRGDESEGKFSPEAGIRDGDVEKFRGRGGKRGNSLRTFSTLLTSQLEKRECKWKEKNKSEKINKNKALSNKVSYLFFFFVSIA
jgi:hypothetical protein